MLASIRRALRPGGELVVIDFVREPGKSADWVLTHVRAGEETFVAEIQAAGFEPVARHGFLKQNYVRKFRRP
jgi:predicted methyltransferase